MAPIRPEVLAFAKAAQDLLSQTDSLSDEECLQIAHHLEIIEKQLRESEA